jgi:hypothetical protein
MNFRVRIRVLKNRRYHHPSKFQVNKTLKYPVIREGVREYLKDNNLEHLRGLDTEGTKKLQDYLLDKKEVSEQQSEFIADRTSIDNFVYALYWLCREEGMDEYLKAYKDRCIQHAIKSYDLIIIFPWGQFPLEDDGVRSAKHMYQFQIQMLLERLVMDLMGHCRVYMLKSDTLEQRTKEILTLTEMVHDEMISSSATEAGIIH